MMFFVIWLAWSALMTLLVIAFYAMCVGYSPCRPEVVLSAFLVLDGALATAVAVLATRHVIAGAFR